MGIKINCETVKGGSVTINKAHGVSVNYAVAGVADIPPSELLYVWAKTQNGRTVQFFFNRETGLIVVDVVAKSEKSGREIVRFTV